MHLQTRKRLFELDKNRWEFDAFSDFQASLTQALKPFPCTLGAAGLAADQLRYHFIEAPPATGQAVRELAAALQSFLPDARSFGKNTSLVVFFKEARDLGVRAYQTLFWDVLNRLHGLDAQPWPESVPLDPKERLWEFCFAGEPIFVVCNTPSHRARKSRYAKHFMLTFQPRWVFDGVIGDGAPHAERIRDEIRRRLLAFDALGPSPDLGGYGDEAYREWKQYFLLDTNVAQNEACPFRFQQTPHVPRVIATPQVSITQVVADLLPPTGSVEVQYDSPYRLHADHVHAVDETLHVIEGAIRFEFAGQVVDCKPGDRLLLPAHTRHQSQAGQNGCLYVIATRIVLPHRSVDGFKEEQHA